MSPNETEKIGKSYQAERPKLLAYIRKRMPISYDAEDLLQDVFFQLTIGFRDHERIENLTAWLYKVTNNRIIDYFRKKKIDKQSYSDRIGGDEDGPLLLEDILPSLGSSPEEEDLKELIWKTLEQGLDELPKEQRDVFIAHEFDDWSFKEISAATGVGVNTLITRKRYAVIALRARLEKIYELFKT